VLGALRGLVGALRRLVATLSDSIYLKKRGFKTRWITWRANLVSPSLEDELERTQENLDAERAMRAGLEEALAVARKAGPGRCCPPRHRYAL
jgi:hypothetical protein